MHFTLHRLLILTIVLLTLGIIFWLAVVVVMAWSILRPPRMSAGKAIYHLKRLSPGDLGLNFEEENFRVRDDRTGERLGISGWWIPAAKQSDRTIVLIHGYADAKVGAIAWAPLLHSLNLNLLAIDLRAHGDSQGRFSTGGFFECGDVSQLIDQITNSRPDQTRQITLFGISLGAAVAVAVAARRSDLVSLILESPFADYERAVAAHLRLMGLPTGLTLKFVIYLAKRLSGARFEKVRPIERLAHVLCPVLGIIGTDDELLDETDITRLRAAIEKTPGSKCWLVKDAGHLQAMALDPELYHQIVSEFLASHLTHASSDISTPPPPPRGDPPVRSDQM